MLAGSLDRQSNDPIPGKIYPKSMGFRILQIVYIPILTIMTYRRLLQYAIKKLLKRLA
jgi:hypothetical protein